MIGTSGSGRETKTTREILDTIDADTLRAARIKGGTSPRIEVNRDRIAALLVLRDEWERPDEVYADEAWEICIIWRTRYGRVEIGTEEDGSVGYYVSRTLSEESREGNFRGHGREEIDRVMSWLDEAPEEIRGEAVAARYSTVRPVAAEQAARGPRDEPGGSGGGSAG